MNWNQFFRDFWNFITTTFELIREVAHDLREDARDATVWTRDNVIAPILDITHTAAQWWYTKARTYTFWGLASITVLTTISICLDIYLKNGVMSAMVGIIIAIPLLFLLILWTPLVGVIGGIVSLLKLDIKSTSKTAMQYAIRWLNICLVIVFWQLIVSFFLSWIPFYNRLISLPFIILASLILALSGVVWKKTFWYRTVITAIVVGVLFFNILGCFSPRFYNSITRYTGAKLEYYASKLEVRSAGNEINSSYTEWKMKKGYSNIPAGTIVRIKNLEFIEIAAEKMVEAFPPDQNGYYTKKATTVPFTILDPVSQMADKPAVQIATTPAVYNVPGKTLTITLQPEEVYKVDELREGQNWRYLSFNGAFSHRIDKGDGKACWKVVDNNLPWSAGWDGKLEVKGGNTPATLTVNIL